MLRLISPQQNARIDIIHFPCGHGGNTMRIWIPSLLYHVFPLLCVIIGFLIVMLIHTPAGIVLAALLYVYSFYVLWLRDSGEPQEQS